ncbi:pyruvate dehydrogenase (quinone) [Pseudoxanthomonas sp. SORGH_AS 997]|uniref:Pyruvate dehydrogenase [ubiquinone] n=1 Tax=Pseudoxanthomonas winnipegensis TaxID=2480810 RepID=A0AAW8GDI1_9GAMM|nr:pyruvate dehydrogenase (quinone) [Pseudoxanthomonas winnipegensis]MDQ1132276.1 pyruvate dehydrogenase (quinone) [Pseudoxanthomonas winnipegensis]MDR6137711.1 pyruvate dehydrogenase (quinone) [Pseudoxanthomonas sp. SORGH_AS_0997]
MPTVADQLVQALEDAGVKRIYGIVGDSLNGITDSIRRRHAIEWLHVRHEEVAAFAAAGEAHVTGEVAVCAGSCGPGNLHLINGLYDAHRSRLPVVAIAAHIPSAEIGSSYFQETHPEHLFKECSSYCELVSTPAQMPRVIETAIRRSIAERCVCVVVIPGDVALKESAAPLRRMVAGPLPTPIVMPPEDAIDRLARLLNTSERITLLCGSGVEGAHEEVIALADALLAPVVHTLRGKEHIEWNNAYDVGMTGLIGYSSGYYAMGACDTLLMLGTDFPYRQFYPQRAKVAQVDLRAEAIGRRTAVDIGLVGEVKHTLRALLPKLSPKRDDRHLKASLAHYAKARKEFDELATGQPGGRLHPQHVMRLISELADSDAAFTADVGLPTVWSARHLQMKKGRRLVGSFWHGSMANAMPHAIGIQATCPGRQVVSLSGDGGFTMLMGDLLSLKQLGLPVKVVVFNNGSLGFIELEQKTSGFIDFGTSFENPNFAAMAEAAGIKGIRIEDPAELEQGLTEAFAHKGPVVIDAVVERMELAMPPKVTGQMAKGFTLYMLKAVLNGKGDEVIELAKANMLR